MSDENIQAIGHELATPIRKENRGVLSSDFTQKEQDILIHGDELEKKQLLNFLGELLLKSRQYEYSW